MKQGIEVDDRKIRLEFFFASDWKFLALIIGIKSPTSKKCNFVYSYILLPMVLVRKRIQMSLEEDWEKFPRDWENREENMCYDCAAGNCDKTYDIDPLEMSLLRKPFSRENCALDTLHCQLRTSELLETVLYDTADIHGLNENLENFCILNGTYFT